MVFRLALMSIFAIYCVFACTAVPRVAFFERVPLGFGSFITYTRKSYAVSESHARHTRDTVRYGDACERLAVGERVVFPHFYAIGNYHFGQLTATGEGSESYRLNAARYSNALERLAAAESIFVDFGCTVGQVYACERRATHKAFYYGHSVRHGNFSFNSEGHVFNLRLFFIVQYAFLSAEYLVVLGNVYLLQISAVEQRRCAELGDSSGQIDALERIATV